MSELDEARKKVDDEQYSERLAHGLLEQIKYSKELEENNKKLRLELHTLRFKESQEQRFIWWVWNVYSRNVQDLILDIMGATTYDTEGEAKEGKYALPKHCFDLLKRVDEYTEHIYDGTYLDVEISTGVKTSTDNNKLDNTTLEYAAKWIENSLVGETNERVIEFGKNMAMSIRASKPSNSDSSVTQNIIQRPADPSLEEDDTCPDCDGAGEYAGGLSDDGMTPCERCNGKGTI